MKSTFQMHVAIATMLATRFDVSKITNAVQSTLNDATLIDGSEEFKRGNVKLVTKGAEFKVGESSRAEYIGKANDPARFARWHDAIAALFKKCGDPNGPLTVDILPADVTFWLEAKFRTPEAIAADAAADAATEARMIENENKRNGKGSRNGKGNVESVKAPVVPA